MSWVPTRLKYVATLRFGFPFDARQFNEASGIPVIRIRDLDPQSPATLTEEEAPNWARVTSGDVLVGMDGDFRAVVWSGPPSWLNQRVCAIDPKPGIDARFLAYAVQQPLTDIEAIKFSTTVKHLSAGDVLNLPIAMSSSGELREVADFLDVETARIDALISRRERQSDLLAERSGTVASALSLRGERTGGGYRASGIAPVGDIPKHWRTLRNKVFLREVTDLSADGSEELLTVSHLTGVTTRAEKPGVTMSRAESTVGYKRCAPGDLVINTMWAWMGALGVARQQGIVSPAYGVYRFDREIADPLYFAHVFRSPAYVAELTRYSKGVWTSRLRLYPEAFLGLSAPVPPLGEQRSIVDAIRRRTAGDTELREGLRRSIALLRERRRALISAAVTGKLQVPDAIAPNAVA